MKQHQRPSQGNKARAGNRRGFTETVRPRPEPATADPACIADLTRIAGTLGLTLDRMPNAFPRKVGDIVRPLKIGVHLDIAALPNVDRPMDVIRKSLRRYTRCNAYIAAMATVNAVRIDLDGHETQSVLDSDAICGRLTLQRRNQRKREKRQAMKDQATPMGDRTTRQPAR